MGTSAKTVPPPSWLSVLLVCSSTILLFSCGSPITNWKERQQKGLGKSSSSQKNTNKSCSEDVTNQDRDSDSSLQCQFNDWALNSQWIKGPVVGDESILRLIPKNNKTGKLIDIPALYVYLWMPDHGHGSSPVSIRKESDGYVVSELYFIMPGKWDIHIQLKDEKGNVLSENVLTITL